MVDRRGVALPDAAFGQRLQRTGARQAGEETGGVVDAGAFLRQGRLGESEQGEEDFQFLFNAGMAAGVSAVFRERK